MIYCFYLFISNEVIDNTSITETTTPQRADTVPERHAVITLPDLVGGMWVTTEPQAHYYACVPLLFSSGGGVRTQRSIKLFKRYWYQGLLAV